MPQASSRLEITTPQDQYYNYCWWKYAPVSATENKLRPVSLLFQSFELAGVDERAFEVVQNIRRALGDFRTVWGTKWIGGRLAWEFYFYDYRRRERDVSITRALEAMKPYVRCDVPVNENLPYFMFSIDINSDVVSGGKELDVVHMYIGNPGSTVSSGIAYGVRRESTTLENLYYFFNANQHLNEAAAKIACSAHFDATRIAVDRILWPELRGCHTICIANKPHNDTAYFSGVNVRQLLFFLKTLRYPAETIAFVESNQHRLDHLLYDVGFDYVSQGSAVWVIKSGYYGVF